jgi:rod shape-determining protein MreC
VTNQFIVPFQNGVNKVGNLLGSWASGFRNVQALAAENEELKARVGDLTEENARLSQSITELDRLEKLYALDKEYPEYTKVAAQVISKDPGNWYSRFVINKGTKDNIAVDMNVIANGGLIGIITEVGENWACVESIIDDESNISAMVASTSDTCIVSGNLSRMSSGKIDFSELRDDGNVVTEGTKIVTSSISTKFLTGLLIGYVSEVGDDSNHLTRSGTIIPAADFKNIREVLVIRELKQTRENS